MSVLPLAVSAMKLVYNLDFNYQLISNEIALMDLRRVLLISYDLEIYDKELKFIYHGSDYSLSMVNNKLILSPGTQIYLMDIDDLNFSVRNESIYLNYQSRGRNYETNIGKEKGIYLDDFSFDSNQLPESDINDEQLSYKS